MSTSPAGAPDFGILLNVAYGRFKGRLHAHLRARGFDDLGPSHGYVFRALADGPLLLARLAERMGISPQGALKVVQDMVAGGYVAREADPDDARAKRLSLTPRGRRALAEARRFHARFERELARAAGATAVRDTRRVLSAMAAMAAPDDDAPALPRPF
ncbi:MAG: MarR family transcriptional regulator [Gemmatimonadetes bacterium]|nr:MarR family transcriptional regulator [Gemmatimonadota bacterium]